VIIAPPARRRWKTRAMRHMVVETYTSSPEPVYRRAAERGRMLRDGLRHVDRWILDDGAHDRCFQLMETDEARLFAASSDPVSFEVHPALGLGEAAARLEIGWGGA
jgi:hypothetical protein